MGAIRVILLISFSKEILLFTLILNLTGHIYFYWSNMNENMYFDHIRAFVQTHGLHRPLNYFHSGQTPTPSIHQCWKLKKAASVRAICFFSFGHIRDTSLRDRVTSKLCYLHVSDVCRGDQSFTLGQRCQRERKYSQEMNMELHGEVNSCTVGRPRDHLFFFYSYL